MARRFQPLAVTANLGYRFYASHLDRFYTCDWPIQALPPDPLRKRIAVQPAQDRKVVCG